MAPKKNPSKPAVVLKIPKERVLKPKFKKEKPKLKTPSIVKVKISLPGKTLSPATPANTTNLSATETLPALNGATTKKMLMLDRINEVARAQLVKDSPVRDESVPEKKVVKKKVGRPKKVIEDGASAKAESGMDTSMTTEGVLVTSGSVPENSAVKKKKPRPKKVTKEEDKTANDVKGIPKKKAKTPQVKPESAKIYKKPKAAVPKKNPAPKATKPVLKRKNPQGGSRTVKRATRGNPKIESESATNSPSILSHALMAAETPANEILKPLKSPVKTVTENTDSRRTSVTSASEWSWTKDISGSSTTTCVTVCSTDFVRFDGKLPVIKLAKVEALPVKKDLGHDLEDPLSDISSSSSSSSSSSDSSHQSNTVNTFLNLSTSSVSPTKTQSPTFTPVDNSSELKDSSVDRFTATLEKLSAKLKSFDLSFMSFSENDDVDPINIESFEEKMHKIMHEEYNALLECNFLSQILSDKCTVSNKVVEEPLPVATEETFAKPAQNAVPKVSDLRNDSSNEYPRRRDSMSFEPNDDDDALSLYAESITGFESSRIGSVASVACEPPAHEEYIPQPIRRDTWAPVERNYQPSKITDQRSKIVCEKQNADSTSIYREPEVSHASSAMPNTVLPSLLTLETGPKQTLITPGNQKLTISDFHPPPGIKLTLLKGVCFFNLISKCARVNCTFPHRQVEVEEASMNLKKLGEVQFIMEYMKFCQWPNLRLKYTKCFILECQRRELPKILVEIVIDFINKINKKSKEELAVKVDIIESALLYLNGISLTVCKDLLQYRFNNNKYLCEVFMETIANTQNFSRFKLVFMNLTSFMVRANMTFSLEVASQILERVCIYPFEAPLAMVLLSIIEKTNRKIFENNMMNRFEKKLSMFDKPMHERLLALKGMAVEPPSPTPEVSPALFPELELGTSLIQSDSENTYTSPDTTNLDNLNKPPVEPVITRTVNLDRVRSLNTSNSSVGNTPHHSQNRCSDWNHRSIYDKIPRYPGSGSQPRFMSSANRSRTPLKRPMGRYVQYGPRQFKFPRFGPEYGKK